MLFSPQPNMSMLDPEDRQQAGYAGLLALAQGLIAGGAPSTQPGGMGRGLAEGLGGFGKAYRDTGNMQLQQKMMGMQLSEAQRKAEFAKQWQTMMAPPSPQNVQLAMAGGEGPTPANAAKLPQNPMLANVPPALHPIMADPEKGPALAMQLAMRESDPSKRYTNVNGQVIDLSAPGGPKSVLSVPDKPDETTKLLQLAGIDPASEQGKKIAAAILERKGQAPQTVLNVDSRQIGGIPPGHMLSKGPNGELMMVKIPGSPAADAADKANARGQQTGGVVIQDIDRAMKIIDGSMLPTTGLLGDWMSKIGGTSANDVRALLDSVRSNAGFKELQAMRESSPTGGALGSITERELAMLQATIGSLEQSQTKEQLQDNMRRVKNVYLDIIHGPGNGPTREKLKFEEKKSGQRLKFDALGNPVP